MASIDHLRSGQPLNITRTNQNKLQHTSVESKTESTTMQKVSTENKSDAFSLSEESRAMNSINQQMATETHFDTSKVEAIKAAIANGSYKVDPEKLAENMLKHEDTLRNL